MFRFKYIINFKTIKYKNEIISIPMGYRYTLKLKNT